MSIRYMTLTSEREGGGAWKKGSPPVLREGARHTRGVAQGNTLQPPRGESTAVPDDYDSWSPLRYAVASLLLPMR